MRNEHGSFHVHLRAASLYRDSAVFGGEQAMSFGEGNLRTAVAELQEENEELRELVKELRELVKVLNKRNGRLCDDRLQLNITVGKLNKAVKEIDEDNEQLRKENKSMQHQLDLIVENGTATDALNAKLLHENRVLLAIMEERGMPMRQCGKTPISVQAIERMEQLEAENGKLRELVRDFMLSQMVFRADGSLGFDRLCKRAKDMGIEVES